MQKHLFIILIIMVNAFTFTSCNKDKSEDSEEKRLPSVETQPAKNIISNAATLVGYISDAGNPPYRNKGFYFEVSDENGNWAMLTDVIIYSGSGTGSFSYDVTALNPLTDYRYYAKAEHDEGLLQGEWMYFTTGGGGIPPVITTGVDEIIFDLADLSDVQVPVLVTSDDENLYSVLIYLQIKNTRNIFETVTDINAKTWDGVYIIDEGWIEMFTRYPEGTDITFNVEANTPNGYASKSIPIIVVEGILL